MNNIHSSVIMRKIKLNHGKVNVKGKFRAFDGLEFFSFIGWCWWVLRVIVIQAMPSNIIHYVISCQLDKSLATSGGFIENVTVSGHGASEISYRKLRISEKNKFLITDRPKVIEAYLCKWLCFSNAEPVEWTFRLQWVLCYLLAC